MRRMLVTLVAPVVAILIAGCAAGAKISSAMPDRVSSDPVRVALLDAAGSVDAATREWAASAPGEVFYLNGSAGVEWSNWALIRFSHPVASGQARGGALVSGEVRPDGSYCLKARRPGHRALFYSSASAEVSVRDCTASRSN